MSAGNTSSKMNNAGEVSDSLGATLASFYAARLADSLANGLAGSAYVRAHGLAGEASEF